MQYRANGRFAGIDLPHFRGDLQFSGGDFPPPPKYGLNKTLVLYGREGVVAGARAVLTGNSLFLKNEREGILRDSE